MPEEARNMITRNSKIILHKYSSIVASIKCLTDCGEDLYMTMDESIEYYANTALAIELRGYRENAQKFKQTSCWELRLTMQKNNNQDVSASNNAEKIIIKTEQESKYIATLTADFVHHCN